MYNAQTKQIANFPQYSISEDGTVYGPMGERKVNLTGGCPNVSLYNKETGKSVTCQIARLVAEAFIPCSDFTKHTPHHKDKNPLNNKVSNLEWVNKDEYRKQIAGKAIAIRWEKYALAQSRLADD